MNDHVEELLALYALGGLEPDELQRVEAHLAVCGACRQEADRLLALTVLVSQSAPQVEPKPELRSSILQRIQGARLPLAPRSVRPERPSTTPPRRATRPALSWAVAAVGVLTLVSLVGWNLTLSAQVSDLRAQSATQAQQIESLLNTTHTINLTAQGPLPDASGRAFVSDGARTVVIMVQLRPLESDQTYQTWLITDAGPQPSDVFTVNAEGLGLITVIVPDQLADFTAIGISVEPAGGSQTPTEVVLVGGL